MYLRGQRRHGSVKPPYGMGRADQRVAVLIRRAGYAFGCVGLPCQKTQQAKGYKPRHTAPMQAHTTSACRSMAATNGQRYSLTMG